MNSYLEVMSANNGYAIYCADDMYVACDLFEVKQIMEVLFDVENIRNRRKEISIGDYNPKPVKQTSTSTVGSKDDGCCVQGCSCQ